MPTPSALLRRREYVPNTVPRHNAVFNRHTKSLGSENEDIGRWFSPYNIVPSDDRRFRRKAQTFDEPPRLFLIPRRRYRPFDVHISGRALFFHPISEQQHEVKSQFKRVPAGLRLAQAASIVSGSPKNGSATAQ
jgi:hypothetical protein